MASSSPRKTLSDPAAVFPQKSSDRLLEIGQRTPHSTVASAQSLARLALHGGHKTPLALEQQGKLEALQSSLPKEVPGAALEVYEAVSQHTLVEAMGEFAEVKVNTPFLARKAGLPSWEANRALNLLCSLSILKRFLAAV